MSTDIISQAKAGARLNDLIQELGVHAITGASLAGYDTRNMQARRARSLAAVTCLMLAARQCAQAIGAEETFVALCAAEVPAIGLRN